MNSVIVPVGVIRPIRPGLSDSVNHRLPSGPAVIALGWLLAVRPVVNSVIVPVGVIRPIRPGLLDSVNHRLPSGPAVIAARVAAVGQAGGELGDRPGRG